MGGTKIADSVAKKRHPTIGNNVEIGMNVRIFGPVNIGDNVAIAPFAVVRENVQANSKVTITNQLCTISHRKFKASQKRFE